MPALDASYDALQLAILADMDAVTGNELSVDPAALADGGFNVTIRGDCLRAECCALLDEWSRGLRS